jgi:hypothetical protein
MTHIDPCRAAHECERARKATTDPYVRSMLIALRDLWIALDDESCFLDADQLATQLLIVSAIQARFTAPAGQTLH